MIHLRARHEEREGREREEDRRTESDAGARLGRAHEGRECEHRDRGVDGAREPRRAEPYAGEEHEGPAGGELREVPPADIRHEHRGEEFRMRRHRLGEHAAREDLGLDDLRELVDEERAAAEDVERDGNVCDAPRRARWRSRTVRGVRARGR